MPETAPTIEPLTPELAGVLDGERAQCGPRFVELCLTNRCNMNCIVCWGHSPYLQDREHQRAGWGPRQELGRERLLALLEELAELGTREVQFSGGGEPLLVEGIFDLLARTRALGMEARLLTNLSLLDAERRERLLAASPRTIHVSLWAATPATYAKTHPNQGPETFERVLEHAAWLVAHRQEARRPFLLHGHVLSSANAFELEAMFRLAHREADGITLVPMDPVAGATDQFLLPAPELAELHRRAEALARDFLPGHCHADGLEWHGVDDLLRRLASPLAHRGIYERAGAGELPPCTIGWTYARIEADGSVCSCCKATRAAVGNVGEKSFREIWFGVEQDAFRLWSRRRGPHPRFSNIHCERTCDNVGHNRETAARLAERGLLEAVRDG